MMKLVLELVAVGVCAAQERPAEPQTIPLVTEQNAATAANEQKSEGKASLKVALSLEDGGAFLGDAEVRVAGKDGKAIEGRPTGKAGEMVFDGLEAGKYRVEASAVGYATVRLETEVEAGRLERSLYVVMKPAQLLSFVETVQEESPPEETPKEAPKEEKAATVDVPEAGNALVEEAKPAEEWKEEFPLLKEVETKAESMEPGVACPTQKVLSGAAERMKEFVRNLERFTATEEVTHYSLDGKNHAQGPEKRQFDYVVTVSQNRYGTFLLDETRDGGRDPLVFPRNVATLGLPALALIFHPILAEGFDFTCEGMSRAGGKRAWEVHFAQRYDRMVRIRAYTVDRMTYQVYLKGRAWIQPGSYQVVRLESELERPIPQIGLTKEHIVVEYAPVRFRTQKTEIWLPREAELDVDQKNRQYYRRHTFTDFRIFSVETAQDIQAPKGSYTFINSSDTPIEGVLTVTSEGGKKQETVSVKVVVPPRGRVFKVVGPGKDVNLPASEIASATFVYDGKAEWMTVEANLVKETTLDVIPETAMAKTP